MKIITICGSLKFIEEIKYYTEKLELEGNCVLSVIYPQKSKKSYTPEEIRSLELGHIKKIDISDSIFVINKNGYIGDAVKKEIEHAKRRNKEVVFLENTDPEKNIKKYNKLVRDNILEIIETEGKKTTHEILSDDNYSKELNNKLVEEIYEFIEKNEAEELADVFEVLYTIAKNRNIDLNDVERIRVIKRKERGGFEKKIFLKDVIE